MNKKLIRLSGNSKTMATGHGRHPVLFLSSFGSRIDSFEINKYPGFLEKRETLKYYGCVSLFFF